MIPFSVDIHAVDNGLQLWNLSIKARRTRCSVNDWKTKGILLVATTVSLSTGLNFSSKCQAGLTYRFIQPFLFLQSFYLFRKSFSKKDTSLWRCLIISIHFPAYTTRLEQVRPLMRSSVRSYLNKTHNKNQKLLLILIGRFNNSYYYLHLLYLPFFL